MNVEDGWCDGDAAAIELHWRHQQAHCLQIGPLPISENSQPGNGRSLEKRKFNKNKQYSSLTTQLQHEAKFKTIMSTLKLTQLLSLINLSLEMVCSMRAGCLPGEETWDTGDNHATMS